MGYPGAGKSFFARQFAELYKLARISEDRIRYELFEKPQFNNDELEIIQRVAEYMLEELMQTEQTIIYDGEFLQLKSRKQLVEFAKARGYRTLFVWLQTDLGTSWIRANKRDKRNPDSKYAFEVDKTVFNRLKDELERPGEKEVAVVISGKHAFRSQSLTVLRKITAIYSEQVARTLSIQPASSQATGNKRLIQ